MRFFSKAAAGRLAIAALVLGSPALWAWWTMIRMPGTSFRGELPELTPAQQTLATALRADVLTLAADIGERHLRRPRQLAAAADAIDRALQQAGYRVERQTYAVGRARADNLVAERAGNGLAAEIVLVGAHYDSVPGCPGANDNATGVAAMLALARRWGTRAPSRTLRLCAFANEEPPFFHGEQMGSLVHARRCRDRGEQIVAMLALETLGCYRREPGSQRYPFPLGLCYPSRGDFVSFVGNLDNAELVRRCVDRFREQAAFPCEGAALPGSIQGVGWSDHWSFWQQGYPAVMVTDTAPFRYAHYHEPSDTVDQVDFASLARVVDGLDAVLDELVNR
jgi:Zn-dependent M28 family amino/carboxypeptidase